MHKLVRYLSTITLLTTIAVLAPHRAQADDKKPATEAVDQDKQQARIPFQGKLSGVDKSALTITLEGKEKKRTIHLTSQTRIVKAGKPATLNDAVSGEEVGGQLVRTGDGKEEAISLRLGPKPEEKAREKK